LIPLSEAAKQLGVQQPTLRRQIALGRFAAFKIGPIWVTTQAEIDRYAREILGRRGPKRKS
jgi:excisionase family DNA binding protein